MGCSLIYPPWLLEVFRLDDAILECLVGNHHHIQVAPIIQSGQITFNSECSLEGLMLKLKLQYFGHLMRRAVSLEKDPDAGKD